MDNNRQYRIALVLYTQGLDYDDRIRKEILSIQQIHNNVSFNIFAVDPKNVKEEGVTSYGVPYKKPFLKSRNRYASGTHTFLKAFDFYRSIHHELKAYDAIWCADEETFLFVLFNKNKPLIWDLHELPSRFIRNRLMRLLFHIMERKCAVMIHANEERKDYLIKQGLITQPSKQFVIRNYPERQRLFLEDSQFSIFEHWRNNGTCVYLQGLNAYDRMPKESIESVLSFDSLKAVVVGRFPEETKDYLYKKYGDSLKERVFFTGMVPQLATTKYIQACSFGLVFYKCDRMNNYYCEPNRMFQCIVNGLPIIVGCNPTMKNLVERLKVGVVIDGDGENIDQIIEAIKEILANYSIYANNIRNGKDTLNWDAQNSILKHIIELALVCC